MESAENVVDVTWRVLEEGCNVVAWMVTPQRYDEAEGESRWYRGQGPGQWFVYLSVVDARGSLHGPDDLC